MTNLVRLVSEKSGYSEAASEIVAEALVEFFQTRSTKPVHNEEDGIITAMALVLNPQSQALFGHRQ